MSTNNFISLASFWPIVSICGPTLVDSTLYVSTLFSILFLYFVLVILALPGISYVLLDN